VRLSNSQRTYLFQAAEEYAKHIHLAEEYLSTRHLSVDEAKKFHLGIVKDALPGHESYKGELDTVVLSAKTNHPSIGIPGVNNWKPYYGKILDDFETVIVLADGDNAGLEFGKKLSRELPNVNLLQMPEGHDVNSIIVQEGKEWLDERIRKCLGE